MLRGGRRRFGVSISSGLASVLDDVACALGCNRSVLIENAVKSMLEEHLHYMKQHECCGLVIVEPESRESFMAYTEKIMEKYGGIIRLSMHVHLKGGCFHIFVVEGDSDLIREMLREVFSTRACRSVRFVPLGHTCS